MQRTARFVATLFFFSSLTMIIAADPPTWQGPTFVPGDGVHDASSGDQEEVAIAAGGGGFLTAWTDMRTSSLLYDGFGDDESGRDVYVARLDAAGNLIDTVPIVVSEAAGRQEAPGIAWNGQNWLVVWSSVVSSGTGGAAPTRVYAARIAPDGTVLDSPPIEVFDPPSFAGDVWEAVAANGSDWLIATQADTGGGIQGVRVAGDGTVLDPVPVTLAPDTWFLYFDLSIHVAGGEYLLVYDGQGFQAQRFASDLTPIGNAFPLPASEARVASNGTSYFVVWDPTGPLLYGSRMLRDGTLVTPAGIPIMDSFWDPSTQTDVTWDGTNWWVAHEQPYPDGGLKLARVTPGGTVLDSPPLPAFDPLDEQFVGTWQLTGGAAGGVQLVWADQDCGCADEWSTSLAPWDIHGAYVSVAGLTSPENAISCAAPAQTLPDLAAGPDQFLAVFRSESADVKRIVAQRLDTQGNAIDAEPIEIAASPWVTNPAVAWNGSVYLIVWDEFFYCVGGDPEPCGNFIYAVRMLPDGTVLDPQPITVMQGNHGDVAALGDRFLVVGRNLTAGISEWVIPFAVRVDGSTGALLDPVPLELGWVYVLYPKVTTFMDQWLVVWEQRASHDESIPGTRYNFVTADGSVKYAPLEAGVACGGGEPEVAGSGAAALIVCREGSANHFLNDIRGSIVTPDEVAGTSFLISDAVEQQRAPTVTWTGTEFLVAWEDMRNAIDYFDKRTDLYGARVDAFGAVLDPLGFAIATDSLPEQQPELFTAGADTLLAASNFRDAAPDTNYRLATYHTPATINDPPAVAFTQTWTDGCSPYEVTFTDQSVGDVSTWFWSFGDGGTSFERNPVYVFQQPGTYTVYLTAGGASGPASLVKSDLVTVTQGTAADFWTPVTAGCAPLDVNFFNTSLGDQTGWLWMFGDDATSTAQVPTHTYAFPGSYSISLTATGACGPNTMTKIGYVQIDGMCPIQDGALEDIPLDGAISGTYLDTHVGSGTNQVLQEVAVPVSGGTTWQLEHRWRFDAAGGSDGMEFYVDLYIYGSSAETFHFEYSLDNVSFTPLLTVNTPWSSQHRVPLPPDLQGPVWIRMIDDDRTTADTYGDYTQVAEMAIETGVPTPYHTVPTTMGLQFTAQDSMDWMPTAAATQYDVMSGSLEDLRVNGSVGDALCGWEDNPGTTLLELSVPPPGVGYYYIIRGDAPQLEAGSLDNPPGMAGPDEGRDAEVGTAGGSACASMP